MTHRSLFAVASLVLVLAVTLSGPGSAEAMSGVPSEPVEGIEAFAEGQGQAAPVWVTKGAEAFPDLRGRYLFGTAKIEGVKDAGRDPARLDSFFRTVDAVNETLRTLARSVVDAYGKAVLAKPLDDASFNELTVRCAAKAAEALGVEEGLLETYFDEKTKTMHAILLVEVCVGDEYDTLLRYSVFLAFNEELEPVHKANGLKGDAKAASSYLSDLVRAEGVKVGLDCWKK